MRKVVAVPRLLSSQGNTNCTKKLMAELIRPTKEMASPRTLLGNSSENKTHITGPIDTAMGHVAVPEHVRQERFSRVPLGRFGQPEEIAGAVYFLASADSTFVTGSELVVDPFRKRQQAIRRVQRNLYRIAVGVHVSDG